MKKVFRIVMYVVGCFIVVNSMMYFLSKNANGAETDFSDCKTCRLINELNPQWVYSNEQERLMLCFESDEIIDQRKCVVFPNRIHLDIPEG